MQKYNFNPKMHGSGIISAIPQKGKCKIGCRECFFNNRSYTDTPNMPPKELYNKFVVRVNDGNDSNNNKDLVICETVKFPHKFYNTSVPDLDFPAPVVLTINPSSLTDIGFHRIEVPPINLMFVRIRVNMWNLQKVVIPAIEFYTSRNVPVVLTFMAYSESKPQKIYLKYYKFRKRTTNEYWAIRPTAWRKVMKMFRANKLVYSCGEGHDGSIKCLYCGNCIREYWNTIHRMYFNLV